ncbi:hemolysin family protein [Nocardioides acrostichi]|uniref:HlyC/CorC family transporter n=1 Tax=Nocardioides acrostichi TaxID=2784339 RepID=A0A930UXD5_9ACTN|nr:hemolysin family protein [Nocardioides acrostichi]MBF4161442.1 HlyC/CorC family transporter [Nocardioides acrostichi]
MSPVVVGAVTVALIVLSAFFVATEFAVLAARRHRLEARAAHSAGARAAVRSVDELTIVLAACQLGITACALGLGAVTKPALKYAVTPLLDATGAPSWTVEVVAFAVAIGVVTFLHLVVGEMAPKSWAIAHPETAAVLLAPPMRGFMALTRPVLRGMNAVANALLRRVGVEPRDTAAVGHSPADLRALVRHSATVGTLEAEFSAQVDDALDLDRLTVDDLDLGRAPTAVGATATVSQVREAARRSRHLRIVLVDESGAATGMVHVRDTLDAEPGAGLADLRQDVLTVPGTTSLREALSRMQRSRVHLGVVPRERGGFVVVTLHDLLARALPAPTHSEVPR